MNFELHLMGMQHHKCYPLLFPSAVVGVFQGRGHLQSWCSVWGADPHFTSAAAQLPRLLRKIICLCQILSWSQTPDHHTLTRYHLLLSTCLQHTRWLIHGSILTYTKRLHIVQLRNISSWELSVHNLHFQEVQLRTVWKLTLRTHSDELFSHSPHHHDVRHF